MNAAAAATEAPVAALSVLTLSKSFSHRRVLSDVSFNIAPGEVHALLGQNGSGKSTLIKCLAGVYAPDPGGSVHVAGKLLPYAYPPSQAKRHHLAFVHQDLGLLSDMTVMENLALGEGFCLRGPLIRWGAQRAHAKQVLDEFRLNIRPNVLVKELPVTARTLLAIARALQTAKGRGPGNLACLVLDEPTAALPDHDAEILFESIDRVTAAGVAVAYVTHRLEEVFRLAQQVTILRDGQVTLTAPIADLTHRSLVSEIVGEKGPTGDQVRRAQRRPTSDGPSKSRSVLKASGLYGRRIKDVSLTLHAGEIVGLAGLAGSGRSELARLLFGAQKTTGGSLLLEGETFAPAAPRQAMKCGLALVPEDRRREGCVLTMSVAENMTLTSLPTTVLGTLDLKREQKSVRDAIREFDIRPPLADEAIRSLSGGNQQKVVLAKWLARRPTVLILDEPVQGVDVGAKSDIFDMLRNAAAQGTALLVIDSDFANLVELCDRVVALRNGKIVAEMAGNDLTHSKVSSATFGVVENDGAAAHA